MENPTAAVAPSKKGRKRPASSAAQQKSKRFQDDAVLEEGVRDVAQQEDVCPAGAVVQKDGVQEAVASSGGAPQEVEPEGLVVDGEHCKDAAPQTADPPPCPEEAPGLLVRQDTFTKDDGDGAGGGPEHFYIPVEQKENAGRREALFKRLSARRKESTRAAAARKAASSDAPKAKTAKAARRKAQPSPQPPPQPAAQPPPALQRQGTFTIEDADDEDPRRHKEPGADLMDPGEQEPPPASDDEASTASLKTVAEMRVALATLRRGRAAAERGERAARERASRDALRTRAALQDLHARLAATREALHAEKDGLHRKLSADFRRALADRDAVWRQERERAATQVRALEAELRAARTQLGSVQAEAQRRATTAEAELRRAFHDQEAALRAQTAEVAAQRDSLQAQLRAKDKQAALERPTSPALRTRPCARQAQRDEALQRTACALRRELLDARRRHALLEARLREAQQAAVRRAAPAHWDAELSRALHAKEQEYRRDAAEAAKKHDALEAQLRDALRALREAEQASPCAAKTAPTQEKAAAIRSGKQMTLALESHRQEEEDLDKREEVPGSGDGAEAAQARPGRPPEQVKRRNKRRREDPEPETEDDEAHSNEHNDERRRGLLQELERLRERNAALQEACRAAAVWRRRGRRRGRRPAATAPAAKLRRVLQSQRRQPGVPKHPATETNAGDRETAERLMRHFHRLISLEPVSEAEEFPVPGGGLVGLGGPLGGSLGGPQSPLSSGPSSLSPTPGIGDVWNDLAAGCATSSGGSPCSQGGSSGSSSPGGESLGEAGSPPPEQLAAHSVMYWQLMRDHLQLQRAYQQMQQLQQLQASSKHSDRQARAKLEAQVYDLKRALSRRPCLPALPAQTHGAALADALQDVVELRQREQALTAELTELRDQNELLEFRLLELEGIVDKSSVCSGTRDVCTDTESDTVTEDSGLLSLGASDDGDSHANPAHQPGDGAAVREKLALLASSLEAEEDRGCLQRALQLLDSYQQQLNKDAAAKPHAPVKAPNQRIVATVLPFTGVADDAEDLADTKQSSRDEFRRKQEFFNQIQRLGGSSASPTNGPGNTNAGKTLKHADCLQESGIFEEEAEDGVLADLASAATQTEAAWACSCHQSAPQTAAAEADAPFSSLPAFGSTPTAPSPSAGALSAEIQKLSQIRERFEEQGAVTKLKRPEAPALAALAPSALGATQMQLKMRELDFFRARAAVLEDKLAELERCSDPELRGCARLLERVAALERQAREAREAADLLVRRNRDLEEERCELEEAENDTRLRCQQLEVEVVQLREREGALEVELGRARRSLSAAHQLQGRLEMALQSLETRNFELEEAECELRASIAAVESALPAIVAFHLAHYRHYLQQREQRAALPLPAPVRSTAVSTEDTDEDDADVDEVDGAAPPAKRDDSEVLERLAQLVAAEQDMHQKIAFLEQKESAFQETLAAADGLWTEMELNYKRRLARAEEAEEELRRKVRRLEDSESKLRQALADQAALSERVHELEAQERVLRSRIRSLEQEKQAVAEEADRFHEEMKTCRGALQALQERIDGPLAEEAAAERRRALDLAEELRSRQDALAAMEQRTNTEISALQSQIAAGEKTMQDMEVTCAELREEVDTLEEAVGSLRAQLSAAHDKAERDLFHMESALASKDQQLEELRRDKEAPPSALNDEIAAAAQAAQQPEEDDDAEQEPKAAPPAATPPSVSLFRKSLQAFRNSEMMMMMTASKPATPPKPVPKKETDGSKAFASLPPMPTPTATATAVKRMPPPLPPKNVLALKWARSDTSAPSGR